MNYKKRKKRSVLSLSFFINCFFILSALAQSHPTLTEIFQFRGWANGKYLGWGLLNPGDLNNDGFDEFISYDPNTNYAYFFWGSFPVDTLPDLIFHEPGKYIHEMAIANIDGDSLLELIIPFDYPEETYIYKLGANPDTIPDIILNKGGFEVCAGDLNGDNFDDIILANPDSGDYEVGLIKIFMGGDPFDTQLDYKIVGDSSLMQLGLNVATGDLNGDNYDDLIAWGHNYNVDPDFDYLRIYFGSAVFDTVYDIQLNDPVALPANIGFTNFSSLITFDYNKDGYDDLFVGGIYIYNGSATFDTIPEHHLIWPDSAFNAYGGGREFCAGDINKDGYPDLAIGMTDMFGGKGLVHVRLGGGHGFDANYIIAEPYYGSGFGWSVVNIGDVDHNGVSDILIGEPYYILGHAYGMLHFYSGDSSLVSTGIEKPHENMPELFELLQNYPNPFNSRTVIRYNLIEKSKIRLSIYNITGQRIKVLEEGIKLPGEYKVRWDSRVGNKQELSSGIYFYRLQAESLNTTQVYSQTIKMVYLK